ncbi:hypothetical protein JTB14_037282 [Gonioctena quinquepunctata]|nr:hypothetical protein JTB14_037282 [Gonioctena quinquepunctata]
MEDGWKEYSQLSQKYKPVDLGLGCPDFSPPEYITNALTQAINSDSSVHQYTKPNGHPRLTTIFSKFYAQLINRSIDPTTEILITSGSNEALFCSIMGHIGTGDEVVLIEPYFTVYASLVKLAGGIPKFVSLKPKTMEDECSCSTVWTLDKNELDNVFTNKTKAIILNTPNNPLGKVFDHSELTMIAELCKKWNVICISDEVYEWMVCQPKKHIRIASLSDMFERTITIGAAEKSFCVTGWQVGWAYGPSHLLKNLQNLHQLAVYNASTPLQEAFAILFEREYKKLGESDSHFLSLEKQLCEKRDFLLQKLIEAGMKPIVPDGGFFIAADISKLASRVDLSSEKDEYLDVRFSKWLIKTHRLQGLPTSLFFTDDNKRKNETFVRFCFYKKEDTLNEAAQILERL